MLLSTLQLPCNISYLILCFQPPAYFTPTFLFLPMYFLASCAILRSHLLLILPHVSQGGPPMQLYHLPAQHARRNTNTRTAWQGHLPVQDIPISRLPPSDHRGPTCTRSHTALLSHMLHLSPNRGSWGASA